MGNGPSKSTYRVFIVGVLMIIVVSTVVTCVSGDCFHWVPTIAAIVVLYRVLRGAER